MAASDAWGLSGVVPSMASIPGSFDGSRSLGPLGSASMSAYGDERGGAASQAWESPSAAGRVRFGGSAVLPNRRSGQPARTGSAGAADRPLLARDYEAMASSVRSGVRAPSVATPATPAARSWGLRRRGKRAQATSGAGGAAGAASAARAEEILTASGQAGKAVFTVKEVPESLLEGQVVDLSNWSVLVDAAVLFRLAAVNAVRAERSEAQAAEMAETITRSGVYASSQDPGLVEDKEAEEEGDDAEFAPGGGGNELWARPYRSERGTPSRAQRLPPLHGQAPLGMAPIEIADAGYGGGPAGTRSGPASLLPPLPSGGVTASPSLASLSSEGGRAPMPSPMRTGASLAGGNVFGSITSPAGDRSLFAASMATTQDPSAQSQRRSTFVPDAYGQSRPGAEGTRSGTLPPLATPVMPAGLSGALVTPGVPTSLWGSATASSGVMPDATPSDGPAARMRGRTRHRGGSTGQTSITRQQQQHGTSVTMRDLGEPTVDPTDGTVSGGASQFAMPSLSASAMGSPGSGAFARSGDPSPMRSTVGALSASSRAGAAARTDDGSAVASPARRARRNRRRMFSTPMVAVAPTADPLLVEAARPPLPPTSADPGFRSAVLHTLRVPRADGAQDAPLKAVAESARGLFRALDVSGALNLTDAGLRAVAMASPLLTELKLDGCEGVRGAGLAAVADCCPRLRTLGLARCSWVPGWVLARLGAGCPAIETLDLSGHDRLKDDDLRACVRGMTALTDVSLPLCTSLSDPGVLAVAQAAPGLRKLLLDRRDLPYKITDVACLGLAQHCTALETLSLVNCEKISDSGLSWLAGACHSLTSLDLRGCTKVSDVGMRALAEGTPLLRRLRLAGCKRVGDVGVRHLAGGCPELGELDFGGLFLLSDGAQRGFAQEGLQALADAAPPIEALNLGGCTQVGDRIARRLPRAFPDLKRLTLSACGRLTAPGLRDCFAGLPALTAVNLRSSRDAVTDGVLAALASTARASLTSLCVADCSDVSDRGVSALARRCRSLQTLDMTGCKKLTDLSLFALADADLFPGLKDLSFRGCEGVTETGVSWLAMRSTTITRLELSGCAVSRTGLAAMSQAFAHAVVRVSKSHFGYGPAPRGDEYREIAVYGRTWAAAASIQALFRGGQARKRVTAIRRARLRVWLATQLQALGRGARARFNVALLWLERKRERRAAIRFQAAFRGLRARREAAMERHRLELLRQQELVRKVQAAWRGRSARRLASRMRAASEEHRQRMLAAAVLVQRVYRGWRGRGAFAVFLTAHRLHKRRQDLAATNIQRLARGVAGRRKASLARAHKQAEEERRFRAARTIQGCVRGRLARRTTEAIKQDREALDAAATAVQAAWRARRGRMHAQQVRQERRAMAMEDAALLVQRAWRGKAARVAMKLVRRARAVREKQLDDAARFVQRVWLGHRGRLEAARLSRLLEMDALKRRSLFDWAAVQVQRRWRGELGRRRADAEREARARRWKQMWDDRVGRPFWYDKLTGEIRWRKPQEALNLEPKAHCSNCEEQVADVECKDCSEFYCQTCFAAVHGGGKRRHHAFRALNDYYGSRIDYGEGEWPALWPSEVRQDEFAGWMPRSQAAVGDAGVAGSAQEASILAQQNATAAEAAAAAAAASVARGGRAVPAATHIHELSSDADVRPAAAVVQGARTGGGLRSKSVREAANDGWTKVQDPATGAVAYFDVKTGVLSNDRPSFFVSPRGDGADAGERKVGEDGLPVFQPPTSDFPVPPGPGKAVPEPGPGGWLKYVVAGEGGAPPSVYYYNAQSGDSTWDRPPEYATPRLPADGSRPVEAGPPGSGWARFQDEASGASYYYNETSGESSWDRPAGFSTPRPAHGEAPTEVLPGWSWAKYWSEEHGADYWLDHVTGESSWERPVGWGTPRVGDGYGVAPSEASAWAQGDGQGYDGQAAADGYGYGAGASVQGYAVDASGYEGYDNSQLAGYGHEGYAAEGYATGAAEGYDSSAGYGQLDQSGYGAAAGSDYAAHGAYDDHAWDA